MATALGPGYSIAGADGDTSAKADPSASATTEDTDDDNISITSTLYDSDDSQMEYNVEAILAQDDDMDGVTKYLVRWTNYPLEKCTWEPEENMGRELLRDLWEKKRKRRDYRPFDIALYFGAVAESENRHLRRNLKRKKLGQPQTYPFLEEEESVLVRKPAVGAAVEAKESDGADSSSAITKSTETADDSDDDVVVIEALSAPPPAKKKKKKQKQDVSPMVARAKDEVGAAPNTLRKQTGSADTSELRPVNRVSATPTTSDALLGKAKRPEKRVSVDGGRKATMAGPVTTPKGLPTAIHHITEQRVLNDTPRQANTPTETNAKEPALSSKARPSKSWPDTETAGRSLKTFSARKSGTTSQETGGNAFNSGKRIRFRSDLASAMSDPTRPQQLFGNRRTLRLAEIRERDKPDRSIEPGQLSTRLFPISQGPPAASTSSTNAETWQDVLRSQAPSVSTLEPELAPALAPTLAQAHRKLSLRLPPVTMSKRKKSVRFSTPNNDDDKLLIERVRLTSPPAGRHSPVDDNKDSIMQNEPAMHEIPLAARAIRLLIGSQRIPVEAALSVMAQPNSSRTILEEVFAEKILRFAYSCLAETLLQQLGGIRENISFSGDVMPAPEKTASSVELDTISQRLKAMTSGLILLRPAYAVLLYPTQCEEWDEARFGFPPLKSGGMAALRYIVFNTYIDGSALIRPPSGEATEFDIPAEVCDREHLMRLFCGLDRRSYIRLFPGHAQHEGAKRNVFLAFPPSSYPFMQQLALWIHVVDPDCAVFYSTYRGAWMAFLGKVATDLEVGAVIVYELLTSTIRRFPGLNSFLLTENGGCRFWSLSQSILFPPLFSPAQPLNDGDTESSGLSSVGRVTWTQLFPDGLAILVTPSFIVSEPHRVYDLFRWVAKVHRTGDVLVTLVTVWDICGYLREIADETFRLRNKIQTDRNLKTAASRREEAVRAGIVDMECRYRYETWLLASEICDTRTSAYSPPMTHVDKAIDGNDEQSLVNWFGWWSALHADQYRSFHVVGSDMAMKNMPSGLATRKIRVPSFAPGTVAEPDVARERMHDTIVAISQDVGTGGSLESAVPNIKSALSPWTTKSQRYPNDSPSAFTAQLMKYNSRPGFWRFYGFAVCWRDADEAFKFGSLHSSSFTIRKWFSFTWPFNYAKYRTYIGLFYLIDDSWDPSRARQEDKPPRHPWVVIYRPVHAHNYPYEKTELIFWDVRAKNKFRGRDMLFENDDLTAGQRAVVDYVREHGPAKNEELLFSRIYIGGELYKSDNERVDGPLGGLSTGPSTGPSSTHVNELDATMEYLDGLARDLKALLPPTEIYLEARGFKEVLMAGHDKQGKDKGAREWKEEEQGETIKIVFHAPRGERPRHIGSSKCRNRFYEAVRQVRMRDPRAATMVFEFRPTTEWYLEQVEEGRSYEHVQVDSWEAFFKLFGVEKTNDD